MDIAHYLADLLTDHDEVGIPGLGKLYKEKLPARFDHEDDLFHPPSSRLAFADVDPDDGTLAAYISRTKNISLTSAAFFSSRFGEETRKTLDSAGKADLSPLGWLELGDDGIRLNSENPTISAEHFGLTSLKELDLTELNQPQVEMSEAKKHEAENPLLEKNDKGHYTDIEPEGPENESILENSANNIDHDAAEANESALQEKTAGYSMDDFSAPMFDRIVLKEKTSWIGEIQQGDDDKQEGNSRKWIVTAIVLLTVALLAAGAFFFKDEIQTTISGVPAFSGAASHKLAEPGKNPVGKSVKTAPGTLPVAEPTIADSIIFQRQKELYAPAPGTVAEIITGTFKDKAAAGEYQAELTARKIPSHLLIIQPNQVMVSVGAYKDMSGAIRDIARFKTTVDSTAFICPVNLTATKQK